MTTPIPTTVADVLAHDPDGSQLTYVHFWGHRRRDEAVIGEECLSQWYASPFDVAGQRYVHAEQFMMAEKAALFGDTAMRGRILDEPDPGACQRLGRGVANFDPDVWTAHRSDIVERGNLAKFGQSEALGAYLRSTGTAVLVEASPHDRIWGIGLSARDASSRHPYAWKGLNLLGFALMRVRARLVATDGGEGHG